MTKHIWASPNIPIWYVLDRFEEKMTKALGLGWAHKKVYINTLQFVNRNGDKYPMSRSLHQEEMDGGTLWHLLIEARMQGAESVSMSLDFHIMDICE